jgi:predicted ATPase/signal transduction histidine kinase
MTKRVFSAGEGSEYELELLHKGADFALYRGSERGSAMPILAVAAEPPSPQTRARLEHEFSLARELDAAWAAQPLALTHQEVRTLLILKDPGGEPLDRLIERHEQKPLDLNIALPIAIGLASSLGQVHRRGLIHKDVKPANALVDDAGNVWLTGFGIASRLPRERQAPAPPEIVAGTLAYMSPEQTGRMNRSIDTRSDLYSLGVTLYQILTGVLPFAAADPLEWVHCHIARQPVPPADRCAVPEALSAITLKLLAKNAEERYQTALGLEADLRRCLSAWHSHGRIDSFLLGADDLSDRLLIPERLYGREREVDTLLTAFDRVIAGGRPELLLVSGYSGIGKSAVVNELHKSLISPHGLFASGKFDQYKRDIPYATIAQAFHSLIRPLLSKPEGELSRWRDDLCRALGANGSLIVDLVPELKSIIGEQPPVIALPPQEGKTRAQLAFRQFIGVFARPEHPLALFLDDLQWLDAATLDFLEDLLVQQDGAHLLVVGAYRDNEVDPMHPLIRRLSAIRQAGGTVREIHLKPLGSDDLARLITDTLHCDPRRAMSLAQLVREKTAGNPFFAVQFIHALVDEGLIAFEYPDARWRWDLDAIRMKGYTDNVADLMVAKLNRLPVGTQQALQQLACIGDSADTATLSAVLEKSEPETELALWEALHQQLIVRSEHSYRFVHDRIQEAAYSLIAEELRPEAHLRIGRLLHTHVPAEKREEAIFEIVSQLNRGAGLITSEDERFQLAQLNLVAGKRAKVSAAYVSALHYGIAGQALLTDECWERRHDLTFQLELHRAECEFLTGELISAAERADRLRSRATDNVELAMATCLGIDDCMMLGQNDRAIAIALDYLRRIGIDCPLHPTDEQVRTEYERCLSQLASRQIEDMIDLPLMSDPASIATLDVLTRVPVPALFTDSNLHAAVICLAVGLSIERGNDDASCFHYVWLGSIAWHKFGDFENAHRFAQLGYELVEKRGLQRFGAETYIAFGSNIAPWMKPLSACRDLTRQALDIAMKTGDLRVEIQSRVCLNNLLLPAGDPLIEVQTEAESSLNLAQKAKFGYFVALSDIQLALVRTLRGSTKAFGSFEHAQFDPIGFERNLDNYPPQMYFCYWNRRLQALYFAGDFASAVDASLRAQPLLRTLPTSEAAEYEFYSALARAAAWASVTEDQWSEYLSALAAHCKLLQTWAEYCPENFQDRAELVAAELARIEGRDMEAGCLYERAIESARKHGFIQNAGLAHELAARYCLAHGLSTAGYAHLRNARNCFDRWGAHGKVKQLDERYPRLHEERTYATSPTLGAFAGRLDVEAVAQASQALSTEIVFPTLIEKLVRIVVENAGAERGLLILIRDLESRIEAEATTGHNRVEVTIRSAVVMPSDLLLSVLDSVVRTREAVLLDDASADAIYSKDEYVRQKHSRSILCLPIVKQAKLVGALYLENGLTPSAFTPDRVAVLQLLAAQAAISLENAALYSDLQRAHERLRQSEDFLTQAQRISQTGSFGWNVAKGEIYWSDETFSIFELDRAAKPTFESVFQIVYPDDRPFVQQTLEEATRERTGFDVEYRLLMRDGRVKHVHASGRAVSSGDLEIVGAIRDITERSRAEEALRQAQGDLARINRVTTIGELAASLAHELGQPISGAINNASTCLRKLDGGNLVPDELRAVVSRFARDAQRAADIIGRIRALIAKGDPNREIIDVNEINQETVALLRDEAVRYNISVRTELAGDLPRIVGDRVQLQQVAMNLIVNGFEAMKGVEGTREVMIKSERAGEDQILVSVSDTGVGFPPQLAEQIFEPFFTTKAEGTGMGLRICRSIVEAHGGRMWAVGTPGQGATFHLSLPVARHVPQTLSDSQSALAMLPRPGNRLVPNSGGRAVPRATPAIVWPLRPGSRRAEIERARAAARHALRSRLD